MDFTKPNELTYTLPDPTENGCSYATVVWKQLDPRFDVLRPGDMSAAYNPNTPERQGEGNYNLQMQAVHPDFYNLPVGTNLGPNSYHHWRPTGIRHVRGPVAIHSEHKGKIIVP